MATPEQLSATRIRIAAETAVGSGEAADPGWIEPPMTDAAIGREYRTIVEKTDIHRQLSRREIVHQSWLFKTRHEIGHPFLHWLLKHHMTDRGGDVWTLDPEAEGASFVVETTSDAGHISRYAGARVAEIQITWEERRICVLTVTWVALWRDEPEAALPGDTDPSTIEGEMLPTRSTALAIATGAWGADPRIDNAATMHGGQLFLSRRTQACNFGPDGIASQHTRRGWKAMAEVFMPHHDGITDDAFSDRWTGRLAIYLGDEAELRIESAVGFVADEDLKAYDWRVRRLAVEAQTDDRRAILELRL